jgi:hypothetical protein
MAKALLKVKQIDSLSKIGRHADGDGLYLIIEEKKKDTGVNKRWVARYFINGRARETGLGGYPSVALAEARARNDEIRKQVRNGIDPIAAKKQIVIEEKQQLKITFGQCADELIAMKKSSWKNEKHSAQWEMTLTKYCSGLRSKPVNEIGKADVVEVLRPIWGRIPETAGRVRMRVEAVLDYAKAKDLIDEALPNPARLKGNLEFLLPEQKKKTQHYGSLPAKDLPGFMVHLRNIESISARALEFLILTASRTSEVTGARWSEIDLAEKIWRVPADRMKASADHEVPLCDRAIAILKTMQKLKTSDIIFSGRRPGTELSNMTMANLLARTLEQIAEKAAKSKAKKTNIEKIDSAAPTVHGFRATFKTWCSDYAQADREIAEHALAHTVGNKVERAYKRTTLLAMRRQLMEEWAAFCSSVAE